MAIIPNSIQLNYKKLSTPDSSVRQTVSFDEPGTYPEETQRMLISDGPDWLSVYRNHTDSADIVAKNTIIENMSAGTYNATVQLTLRVVFKVPAPGEPEQNWTFDTEDHDLGTVSVQLNVSDTIELSLTPNPLNLNYQVGGDPLSNQAIAVQSESAWNAIKTKNWVTLVNPSGNGNGYFEVQVDPIGLGFGTHYDTITVTDGAFSKNLDLALVVSEADTNDTYLYVAPGELIIDYTLGGYNPIKYVELNASSSWTASSTTSWLTPESAAGDAGAQNAGITLDSPDTLTPGNYFGEVVFSLGGLIKRVSVTLNVYELINELLPNNQLLFSLDPHLISISSLRENTIFSIEASAIENQILYRDLFQIPVFSGNGDKDLGSFVERIIGTRSFSQSLNTGIFIPYFPVLLNHTISEEDAYSDAIFQSISQTNIKYMKGNSPETNTLCSVKRQRYLTTNGVVLLSFLANEAPLSIEVTGDKTISFPLTIPEADFYTAVLKLSDIPNLEVGDEITVSIAEETVNISIIEPGFESIMYLTENKWGVFETIEFTGKLQKGGDLNYSLSEFDISGNRKNEIYKAQRNSKLKLSTGPLYSEKEIEALNTALLSNRHYLVIDGEITEVVPTSKKVLETVSSKYLYSYNLEFKLANQ